MKKHFFLLLFFPFLAACTPSLPQNGEPGILDDFAQCLTEKGAIFYGTEWCPHCKKQKKMFGNSVRYINFVDCDKEKDACATAGVKGYPTWKFADGTSLSGTQFLKTLAEKTGCTAE